MFNEIFFNYIYIIVGILFILVFFLIFYSFKQKKRLDVFFKNGEKDLEKVLVEQVEKAEKIEKDLEKVLKEISKLKNISQKSFQKIGIVRFNPFKEVGGDQSFSIALLDFEDNGFIMTSHYSRELNRVYTKEIKNGKSKHSLSEEERIAIKQAMGL